MPGELLLDTGAFVALVDRSEGRHLDCVAVPAGWSGSVVTTEAVLTETLHLVAPTWRAQKACLEFVLRRAFIVIPSSEPSLRRTAALMEEYADLPMGFADGTPVALGEELGTNNVFTLDQRDFAVYRLHGRTPFRIVP